MSYQSFRAKEINWLNVIFRARNKNYGAYNLRIIYPNHIKKSLGFIIFLLFTSIFGIQIKQHFFTKNIDIVAPISEETILEKYTIQKPNTKIEKPKNTNFSPIKNTQPLSIKDARIPKIVDNTPINNSVETQIDLLDPNKILGKTNQLGELPMGNNQPNLTKSGSSELNNSQTNEDIFEFTENEPYFISKDPNILLKYIVRNTKYPSYELENDINGSVLVSFVIEPDGSVSNIELLKSSREGFNNEAIRVIKNMPKWTPGYQNGKAVRVRLSAPINFQISD